MMAKSGLGTATAGHTSTTGTRSKGGWHWHPALPFPRSPLATWPIRPLSFIKNVVTAWLPISDKLIVVGLSLITWFYFTPPLEDCRTFEIDWIAQIYLRNLALMVLVAGGLHLYLYVFRCQGNFLRFDSRELQKDNKRFTFNNQTHDNMFWTIASGVTCWTAYEVVGMWAYANGLMPYLAFDASPVLFVLMFVLIQLFGLFHFYWIHRLIHWPPLYRTVHYLHHRNVNVGPWSGMSMHPIEHLLYLSSVLIHVVVASHPIHFIFHLQQKVFLAASSHAGFDTVTVGRKSARGIKIGDFFHQLHHRYFECNYGEPEVPFDEWFGSFHDGTNEATKRVQEKVRKRRMKV